LTELPKDLFELYIDVYSRHEKDTFEKRMSTVDAKTETMKLEDATVNGGGNIPFGKEMRKQFLFSAKNRNLNHGMQTPSPGFFHRCSARRWVVCSETDSAAQGSAEVLLGRIRGATIS